MIIGNDSICSGGIPIQYVLPLIMFVSVASAVFASIRPDLSWLLLTWLSRGRNLLLAIAIALLVSTTMHLITLLICR